MTVKEVFELRKQGRVEEAYDIIRPMYAVHKGKYTTLCMFWTASDVLKLRLGEGRTEEALAIFRALTRVWPNIDDHDGRAHATMLHAALRLAQAPTPGFRMLDFMAWLGVERLTEDDWQPFTGQNGKPLPCLAHRMLAQAFYEIQQQPTVDNALLAMPLLQEVLHRNPNDEYALRDKDIVQEIINKKSWNEET